MAFVIPTTLRLTQGGVVNLDFLTSDNTARLTQGGIVGNGLSFAITTPPTTFKISWFASQIQNQLIGAT